MTVRIEQGVTPERLVALYSDPLMARTGDDLHPARPIDHPLLEYISVFDDDEFMGAYIVIEFSVCEREVHMLLHRKATGVSREASRLLVDSLFEDPQVLRVTAWVLETIPTAVNHCRRLGFQIEGRKRDAVVVGGKPRDHILLGVTRDEWNREGSR